MRSFSFCISLCVLLCVVDARAIVVLSEVMFDPDGDEASDEFIELFNNSAFPVQLSGWTVSDGESTDTLADAGQGLLATPNQYIIIIDPDYVENSSVTYDGLVPESALIVTISNSTFGSRGLSNSTSESVIVRNSAGSLIAEYEYSTGNIAGHSDEKIRLILPDEPSNWSDSQTLHGTPGFRNSVTPPDIDLAVTEISALPAYPQANSMYDLSVVVKNLGDQTTSATLIVLADSANGQVYQINSVNIENISPADSSKITTTVRMPGNGIQEITARLQIVDDDSTNNALTRLIASETTASGIVFNEIQFAPLPGRAEWIELTVGGTFPVATNGILISDGNGIDDTTRKYPLPDRVFRPGDFVVVSADSAIINETIPFTTPTIILDAPGFTLNNAGDSLVLYAPNGDIIDRVDYRSNWGNNETGTSLERLSVDLPSNDSQNWNSSVDSYGSTPGRANSRTLSTHHSTTDLSASPSPFTPNGDGIDDLTEIKYTVNEPGHPATLSIFDVRGRLVKRFGIDYTNNTGKLLWDGRKDNGTMCVTGRYILFFESSNDNGSPTTTRTTMILARPK